MMFTIYYIYKTVAFLSVEATSRLNGWTDFDESGSMWKSMSWTLLLYIEKFDTEFGCQTKVEKQFQGL